MIKDNEPMQTTRQKTLASSATSFGRGSEISAKTVFACSLIAMVAYPVGAIALLLSETAATSDATAIIGWLLLVAALFALAPVLASRIYTIASEQKVRLDEFEQQLRLKAMTTAYTILGGIVGLGLFYVYMGFDAGWWLPREQDHVNGIFWGFVLYVMTLPPLLLSWRLMQLSAED